MTRIARRAQDADSATATWRRWASRRLAAVTVMAISVPTAMSIGMPAASADAAATAGGQITGYGGPCLFIPQPNGSPYKAQSHKCLDDANWATNANTQLQVWDCSGLPNQQWTLPTGWPVPFAVLNQGPLLPTDPLVSGALNQGSLL